jgi:hypothetical protein
MDGHVSEWMSGEEERRVYGRWKERGRRTGVKEVLLARSVALDSERKVTSDGEDHDDTEPDLPRLNVPLVEETIVETDGDVV